MTLDVRFPFPGTVSSEHALVDRLTAHGEDERLDVADPRVLTFLGEFARRLLRPETVRRHPEIGSLGFFLRPSELKRMAARLTGGDPGEVRVPRGLVVHFPPATVDTVFAYSWALSAIAGNRNLVRLSSRAAAASEAILQALSDALDGADPVIGRTQWMVSYEHDPAITAALVRMCDVRVIWGGDHAVQRLREMPIPPLARDLIFPDRSSFAVIDVEGWHATDARRRRMAVEGFATDVYWFDQAACSSPRVLCWVGNPARALLAKQEFRRSLEAVLLERGWSVDASMAVEKRVATYGLAASGRASDIRFVSNSIVEVDLAELSDWPRTWLGAGTICHATVDSLDAIVPIITRKDQTMTAFGFRESDLRRFAVAVGDRGIDRIVPFGQALTFAGHWDGYDLLHEFTRGLTVSAQFA
jgi:hypothetical protein